MRISSDYVVVGSGLTGATIARLLHDAGREVLVLERRQHLGGNVHDWLHGSGIRVHTYGPHYFRTGSRRVWAYVNRFAEFYPFAAVVKTLVDGQFEDWPVSAAYIRRAVGPRWLPAFHGSPSNFEEASLGMMPRVVYEKFVKGYTEKQWGVPATALAASLARRFDVRANGDARLVKHAYQGLPRGGYAAFVDRMLAGLPVQKGFDYLAHRSGIVSRKALVFTGPIDEYFGYDLGRLTYRGQRREHEYVEGIAWALPYVQVNNPDPAGGPHIRTVEWKHLLPPEETERIGGTVVTRETPIRPTEPGAYEYPFPDAQNAALYRRYRARAESQPRVLICGRLGEYRYYDMDQAIGRAMVLAGRLLAEG